MLCSTGSMRLLLLGPLSLVLLFLVVDCISVFEPVRPIAVMLSEMVMCMWHNSNISEVLAVNFRARSFANKV